MSKVYKKSHKDVVNVIYGDRKFPEDSEETFRLSPDGVEGKMLCRLPVGLGGNIAKLDPLAS